MDWQDERYVRLFTRDTPEWICWPWQARCVLAMLLRKVDRTGAIGCGRLGVRGLAAAIGLPEDVTRVGLEALVEDGCVVSTKTQDARGAAGQLVVAVRNFIEAQEAVRSDAARQRDHREQVRAKRSKEQEADVTLELFRSRDVTLAVPAVPTEPKEDPSGSSFEDPNGEPPKPRPKTQRQLDVERVYDAWRVELNKPDLPAGKEWFKLVGALLRDGAKVEQLCLVPKGAKIDAQQWPRRASQDSPQILFGTMSQASKFIDLAIKGNPREHRGGGYVPAEETKTNRPPPGTVKDF